MNEARFEKYTILSRHNYRVDHIETELGTIWNLYYEHNKDEEKLEFLKTFCTFRSAYKYWNGIIKDIERNDFDVMKEAFKKQEVCTSEA